MHKCFNINTERDEIFLKKFYSRLLVNETYFLFQVLMVKKSSAQLFYLKKWNYISTIFLV